MSGGTQRSTWSRRLDAPIERLLRLDERIVDRVDPRPTGPVDLARIPWSSAVREQWMTVRDELDTALDAGVRFPHNDDLVGAEQGAEGTWFTSVLSWYGRWPAATCDRFPRTTEILREVPGLQIAGFTVLGGHSHLPGHQGPSKSLRYQVGIRVPEPTGSCRLRIGDSTVTWADGEHTAFDDRTYHEAWNDSDDARYVLFVQVGWPVSGPIGTLHRAVHRLYGASYAHIPARAVELDRSLNPR